MHRAMWRAHFRRWVPDRMFVMSDPLRADVKIVMVSRAGEQQLRMAGTVRLADFGTPIRPEPLQFMGMRIVTSPLCEAHWEPVGPSLRRHATRYLRRHGAAS
jgi:hypothetical protein